MKKTQSLNNQIANDLFIKTKQKRAMYINIPVELEQLELYFCFVSKVFSFLDFEFRKDDDDDSVEKNDIELRGIEEEIN